jgi:hypothetical protein
MLPPTPPIRDSGALTTSNVRILNSSAVSSNEARGGAIAGHNREGLNEILSVESIGRGGFGWPFLSPDKSQIVAMRSNVLNVWDAATLRSTHEIDTSLVMGCGGHLVGITDEVIVAVQPSCGGYNNYAAWDARSLNLIAANDAPVFSYRTPRAEALARNGGRSSFSLAFQTY